MKVKFSDDIYNLKDELTQIKEKYEDKYEELMREVEKKCVQQVFSSGGLMLHRGFYCPSSLDKVCGGANRGKIISRRPKQGYIYYFDEKEQLLITIFLQRNSIILKNLNSNHNICYFSHL